MIEYKRKIGTLTTFVTKVSIAAALLWGHARGDGVLGITLRPLDARDRTRYSAAQMSEAPTLKVYSRETYVDVTVTDAQGGVPVDAERWGSGARGD